MSKQNRQNNIIQKARQLAKWTVARHNFIVSNSTSDMEPEKLLPELMEQKKEIRKILFEAGEGGYLNDVLNRTIIELNARKDQIHVLSEEQARALDADSWTPDIGILPEPFDLTLGEGESRRRYVSLGSGLWTKVPLDLTDRHLEQLRERVKENSEQDEEQEEVSISEEDTGEAFSHAQRCLFESMNLHLTRFAMTTSPEEAREISSSPLNRPTHDLTPVSHELVGIVVSGNTEVVAFSSPSFIKMLGQYMDVDPQTTKFVGATQLRNSFPLVSSPQGLLNLSKLMASRLEKGLPTVDEKDPSFQEYRNRLGLSSAEMFEDVEDYSLLVFSVIRRDPDTHSVWVRGGVDLAEEQDDEAHASWVMLAEAWLDRHQIMGTYILPPSHIFEAVCRLGASFLAGIGQGQSSVVAALGQEEKINAEAMIDVVAFDDSDIPQARSQVPAWIFGLLENSIAQQLEDLFSIDLTILPSDHGLDLDEIPLVNSIEEDTIALMQEHSTKRTLH